MMARYPAIDDPDRIAIGVVCFTIFSASSKRLLRLIVYG